MRHIADLQMQNFVNNRRESLNNTLTDNPQSDTFDGVLFKALIDEVLVDKTKLKFVYRAGVRVGLYKKVIYSTTSREYDIILIMLTFNHCNMQY